MYSSASRGKNIAVTGQLYLGVQHHHLKNRLEVTIVEAKGLAPANSNGTSDPYVKTYLLPDRSQESKRKTRVLRKTLNPVFNETLTDRFGRNSFLGRVRLDLSEHDLTTNTPEWYDLQELNDGLSFNLGELLLAIRFMPHTLTEAQLAKKKKKKKEPKGDFQVLIKRARNLIAMDHSGLSDSFVKCYLLPDRSRSSKHKTMTIFMDVNPIWEEMFQLRDVTLDSLQHRVLEVTVWDFDRAGSNGFIGGLRLGLSPSEREESKKLLLLMDSNDTESAHWKEMMENPGTFIGKWHALRSSMDLRH
ncbi:synaptotagmin-like protein 4 isoform X2 [Corticium candelabrum]|uniref:synaptotagmin-like protein 4 isoform X2 n=1 Tax=Corticium candelabrum TaxID=121492 RepID=UPI002E259718|nr:synaptotagmin-like protein 4 isoform X2 [Corticium candelabrum]